MYLDCFPLAFCFRTNSKHDESLTRVKKLQTCKKKCIYFCVPSVSSYTVCPKWGKYFAGRGLLPYKYTLLVLKEFYRLIILYNGRCPIRIIYVLVHAVNFLVTSAYLNIITSKLLADLWHWQCITGFLWCTATLSDLPIIGKAIFLLKIKPNMPLI